MIENQRFSIMEINNIFRKSLVLVLAMWVYCFATSHSAEAAVSFRIGAVIGDHPPKGAIVLNVGPQKYHYANGHYYKKGKRGFTVVKAPRGAVIRNLPRGHSRVVINGRVYYRHQGVFYRRHSGGYIVVDVPLLPPVITEPAEPIIVTEPQVVSETVEVVDTATQMFYLDADQYEFEDGQFFKVTEEGLVWSETPYGAVSDVLPLDCDPVWHEDIKYFKKDGIIFREYPNGYRVVPAPWE